VSDSLETYVRRMPKAEVHLHLEGSMSPVLLRRLAIKYQTELKDRRLEQIVETVYRYKDFAGFLESFSSICRHLREPADYTAILDDLSSTLLEQNVRYAEIIWSPSIPWKFGNDADAIMGGLAQRARQIEQQSGLKIRWILDCVRQMGPEMAKRTAEQALAFKSQGVAAIGLGGDENSLPMSDYEQVFRWAKANGLFVHVHAGEVGGPEQVWDAVKLLGANRIGHGIQAARDPRLMEYLRDHTVALDICLTSNLRTRAWTPISSHPLKLLYKRGVPVTLSTDDPGLFEVSLEGEFVKCSQLLGFTREDLRHLVLQAVRSAFLPTDEKTQLMQQFQNELRGVA